MGAILEVEALTQADHRERSEVQLREGRALASDRGVAHKKRLSVRKPTFSPDAESWWMLIWRNSLTESITTS